MSDSSSDTNGSHTDSSFELVDKEANGAGNGSASGQRNAMSSANIERTVQQLAAVNVNKLEDKPRSDEIAIKSEDKPKPSETAVSAVPTVPIRVPTTLPSAPLEPIINVNLNESSSPSPKPRSDSMSSSTFFDWIAGNEFINKMAEKAKNSVDTMITTLDPGMREIIYSGGDINIMVTSEKESKICPIRDAFQKVFGRATVSGTHRQSVGTFPISFHLKGLSSQPLSIAAQPIGFENGLKAAKERIQSLRMNTKSIPQNQVIVSVENFIVDVYPDKWFDVGCLCLEDPVQAIHIEVYTQMTPIPNECVNQMKFETPIDYAFKSTGYSLTVGAVMATKLKVSPEDWHLSSVGVERKDIVYCAAIALATLYKNRLTR